jgi:hypothetical protein
MPSPGELYRPNENYNVHDIKGLLTTYGFANETEGLILQKSTSVNDSASEKQLQIHSLKAEKDTGEASLQLKSSNLHTPNFQLRIA